MNFKKPTSKVLAIALFLGLMTIVGGCATPEGGESTEEGTTMEEPTTEEENEKTE